MNFVIENFKLVPSNSDGSVLQASFTVSNITMNTNSLKVTQPSTTDSDKIINNTKTTNTVTTNTATNSNTTNVTVNNTTNNNTAQ